MMVILMNDYYIQKEVNSGSVGLYHRKRPAAAYLRWSMEVENDIKSCYALDAKSELLAIMKTSIDEMQIPDENKIEMYQFLVDHLDNL